MTARKCTHPELFSRRYFVTTQRKPMRSLWLFSDVCMGRRTSTGPTMTMWLGSGMHRVTTGLASMSSTTILQKQVKLHDHKQYQNKVCPINTHETATFGSMLKNRFIQSIAKREMNGACSHFGCSDPISKCVWNYSELSSRKNVFNPYEKL